MNFQPDLNGQADKLREIEQWISLYKGPARMTLVRQGSARLPHLRRLLVPLDGSPTSEQILQAAADLALCSGAILSMVRVVPLGDDTPQWGAGDEATAHIEHLRDEARAYLDTVAARLRKHGVRATWEVRIGRPGEEIARAAETTAADLIIMASRHFSGQPGDPQTGVTDAAIRETNIPVIVATPTG